ncbi:hypothetical protein BU26DRAFT_562457 [Trematosphaeria pertusa]|uniref:Uncharacterized protein n=1 Tax=Trematosphaeria pertusa TaxID=390896 RepID=A0A6A6IKU8_9PLEO|nr:uncharacterized protein BU26DRAFT_562457 [Trematosphaeria pertusa]KAF2250472.1 hypothetical protein BU26DRAFT_562457 [Trematosphaeria pertusa]
MVLITPLLVLLSSVAFSSAFPEAITVTVTDCTPPNPDPTCPPGCIPDPGTCTGDACPFTCDIYDPWPNGACASVNDRVTCTVFDPLIPHAHSGQSFCMCQAGYRGDGLAIDSPDQFRVTWTNVRGDQTHRVFVKPGTTCLTLCNETGANTCSEVPVREIL